MIGISIAVLGVIIAILIPNGHTLTLDCTIRCGRPSTVHYYTIRLVVAGAGIVFGATAVVAGKVIEARRARQHQVG